MSGYIVDKGLVLPGDSVIIIINLDSYVFKIIGVNEQIESKHFGLLISFSDFAKVSNHELKGKEIKIINVSG